METGGGGGVDRAREVPPCYKRIMTQFLVFCEKVFSSQNSVLDKKVVVPIMTLVLASV